MQPQSHYLPYVERLEQRRASAIDTVVVHCTELPDLAMAREYGEVEHYASGTGNSGHYYIDRDGTVQCYVPPERVANHTRGWNPRSVGIELVNRGRYPDWLASRHQDMTEPYPDAQIDALIALLQWLTGRLDRLRQIAGHEDLDRAQVPAGDDEKVLVYRKRDPGPLFPWSRVLAACPRLERIEAGSSPGQPLA